ncbi:hypothetical protein PV08_04471 [Exophiala spinifera]|uniref:Uncharacterized protein n=1 Tax=Exophiala spinifera TaxID=91928 RepID=A0A0D2BF79_9EURO|nr:uncharacterized protein PV08_04471 [Exophiala spinifera]KIW17280.1 hypothetical protein PV08_04471 [Exophiala spinifera]
MKISQVFRVSAQTMGATFKNQISHGIPKPFRAPPSPKWDGRMMKKVAATTKSSFCRVPLSNSPVPAFKKAARQTWRNKSAVFWSPRLALEHCVEGFQEVVCRKGEPVHKVEPEKKSAAAFSPPTGPCPFGRPEIYYSPGLQGGESVWACPCFRPTPRTTSWGATDHLRRQEAIKEGRPFQWPPLRYPEPEPVPEEERCAYCRGWATPMDIDSLLELLLTHSVGAEDLNHGDPMDLD